jgi:hypothetical protein
MSDKIFTPVNNNAQECVKSVLKYLSDITYKQIITGQHNRLWHRGKKIVKGAERIGITELCAGKAYPKVDT